MTQNASFKGGCKRAIGGMLDMLLSRSQQERIASFVQRRVRGEDDDDATTNGEYALTDRVTASGAGEGVVFDVGANQGDWTVRIHQRSSPGVPIYAFEPVATTHAFLSARLARECGGRQVVAVRNALGDENASKAIHVSGNLAGSNSLYRREGAGVAGEATETIEVRRGDDFCREHGIPRVRFLKIDTEGHEMAVLRGFAAMLANGAIDVIQFEYGGTWIDSRTYLKDAFALLQANRYSLGRVMPARVDWCAVYRQELDTFRYSNWVAARPEFQSIIG